MWSISECQPQHDIMLLGRSRVRMVGKTTLHLLTWSHTRALMTAGSQKTDLVNNLWKIKTRQRKLANLDVISVESSSGPQETKSQRIALRPHHFVDNLSTTSTNREAASNPADIIPSLTNYKCNVCGRVYKNRKFLNMHFKKSSNCQARTASLPGYLPPECDPPPKPKPPKPESAGKPHICVNCNQGFKTANELGKHRRRSEKCISSRGDQEQEDRLTKEIIKALGTNGPFVFPEQKPERSIREKKTKEMKAAEVKETNLRWKRDLRSMVATIGGAHVVTRCLGDTKINSYVTDNTFPQSVNQHDLGTRPVEKTKEEIDAEEIELKDLIKAIRGNKELSEALEAAKDKFQCQWCSKEFKTMKGFLNHEARGCKKKPLTPEELAALRLAEEQERNEKIKIELIATRRPLLAAWFDIMVNKGRVSEAFDDFRLLRSYEKWREVVESTKVYDILLRGFARRGHVRRVQDVWRMMDEAGLPPTVDSYISALMSLSNATDSESDLFRDVARQIFNEFLGAGNTVASAIDQGGFEYEDKQQFSDTLVHLVGLKKEEVEGSKRQRQNNLLAEVYRDGAGMLESQVLGVIERSQLDPLVERQLAMEERAVVTVPSILRNRANEERADKFKLYTDKLQLDWKKKVAAALEKRVEQRIEVEKTEMINMQEFLASVPIPRMVDIILDQAREICINSETYSEPCNWLSSVMGQRVMEAYFMDNKKNKDAAYWNDVSTSVSDYLDWYCDPRDKARTHREAMEEASSHFRLDRPRVIWPDSVRLAVGKELFHILVREITIDTDEENNVVIDGARLDNHGDLQDPIGKVSYDRNAFFKVFRPRKTIDVEEVKPHPAIWRLYEVNNTVEFDFRSADLPMICPPLPWVSTTTGAFITLNSELVKITPRAVSDQQDRLNQLPKGALDPVLDSVNQLSSVPWRVNKPLLDLAIKIFTNEAPESNERLKMQLDIPLEVKSLAKPKLAPMVGSRMSNNTMNKEDREHYYKFVQEKMDYDHLKTSTYSQYCDLLYRLSLAKHFENEVLWFPHNLDFRGRAYPLAPLINHMGSDLPRSLLLFAKGKPLGKDGFEWLKLHTINLTDMKKKCTIKERLRFAEEMLPEMLDSAKRPLTGRRWWLESDAPWQTLSACMDVAAALECPDGVENYVSHLPIHQDGSCNGLQHYAAIGRDSLGASAVNLVPSELPGDVYSEIATIVERKRKEDSEAGHETAQSLEGIIRRKVVKRPVMTTVYGVTMYGATKQIAKELQDIEEFTGDLDASSKYLATKTFESLNVLFEASQEIQDWLTECADMIASCGENITWVTPLGLPVVQPYTYLVAKKKGVSGVSMDMKHLYQLSPSEVPVKKVGRTKHKNGFPPNFIHSLDSSHMMLTALHLWSKGVTFASVHDCYWTHASDVPIMNKTCRDQFISLHSSPILENLSEYFLERHSAPPTPLKELPEKERELAKVNSLKRQMLFKSLPEKGDLDLNVIRNSTFFFS